MSNTKNPGTGGQPSAKALREQRQAEALRANLRRRKVQTRERRSADAETPDTPREAPETKKT